MSKFAFIDYDMPVVLNMNSAHEDSIFHIAKSALEKKEGLGQYGKLRRKHLIEKHYQEYIRMLTAGILDRHLWETDVMADMVAARLTELFMREKKLNCPQAKEDMSEYEKSMYKICRKVEEIVVSELVCY